MLELRQTRLAGKRLVVAEEGEDHVGLGLGQLEAVLAHRGVGVQLARLRHGGRAGEPLIRRAKIHRAQPHLQLVARKAQVADRQVMLGEPLVQKRLQPAKMLHALGQRIADDADVVAFVQL